MTASNLILPDNPLFDLTLAASWGFLHGQNPQQYYVTDAQTGLARPATAHEVAEYMYGGEVDEALGEGDEDALD